MSDHDMPESRAAVHAYAMGVFASREGQIGLFATPHGLVPAAGVRIPPSLDLESVSMPDLRRHMQGVGVSVPEDGDSVRGRGLALVSMLGARYGGTIERSPVGPLVWWVAGPLAGSFVDDALRFVATLHADTRALDGLPPAVQTRARLVSEARRDQCETFLQALHAMRHRPAAEVLAAYATRMAVASDAIGSDTTALARLLAD
jgi:hypothetical protein